MGHLLHALASLVLKTTIYHFHEEEIRSSHAVGVNNRQLEIAQS